MSTKGLLPTLEKARRAGNYTRVNTAAATIYKGLEKNNSPYAWEIRSRVTYELHMAAYQQAMALLQKSMGLAKQSAVEARKAGDIAGGLYAQMNMSGLLFPALGKCAEGMTLSEKVCREAETLAVTTTDETTRARALRVAMNTYFHRIKTAMEHGGGRVDVHRWLELVKANEVYVANKEEAWAIAAVKEAEKYLKSKA